MTISHTQMKIAEIAEAVVSSAKSTDDTTATAEEIVKAVASKLDLQPWKHAAEAMAGALAAQKKALPDGYVALAGAIAAVTFIEPEDSSTPVEIQGSGTDALCRALARDIQALAGLAGDVLSTWAKCTSLASGGGGSFLSTMGANDTGGDMGGSEPGSALGSDCASIWDAYTDLMHSRNIKIAAFQRLGCDQ